MIFKHPYLAVLLTSLKLVPVSAVQHSYECSGQVDVYGLQLDQIWRTHVH